MRWRTPLLLVLAVAALACGAGAPPTGGTVAGHDDIPVYPGAVLQQPAQNDTLPYVLPAGTSAIKVSDFYRSEMPARQWRLDNDTGSVLTFSKRGQSVKVTVSDTTQPRIVLIQIATGTVSPSPTPSPGPSVRPGVTPGPSVAPNPTVPLPSGTPGPAGTRPFPGGTPLPTTTVARTSA